MRVYIIDDEEISLFVAKKILVIAGIAQESEIQAFSRGSEAISTLSVCNEDQLPAVILLDLNMPEMDGWRFLEILAPIAASIKSHFKIYILTTSIDKLDEGRARNHPMVSGFMIKPINERNLQVLK